MAHPVGNEHRGHNVERQRVQHIAGKHETPKHYARGGSVHSDEAEDRALIKKEVKDSALKHDGKSTKSRGDKAVRRAKGGHVKHKGSGKTSVNVIVAPGGQHPPMPMPAGGPPMAAGMPPKPPMMPPPEVGEPPPVAGLGGRPGGPMPPRSDGGRAYAKGGKVKRAEGGETKYPASAAAQGLNEAYQIKPWYGPEAQAAREKAGKEFVSSTKRATGGAVGPKSLADKKGVTGIGDRTPIQHSGNKSDTQNIGRGPVITRAAGGPIYSDGAKGKQMAPKLPAGSGGGKARKAKAHMQNKAGHEPWEPGIER